MAKQTNKAKVSKSAIYIPLPDEFLNMLDEPWLMVKQGEKPEELSLLDILITTTRRLPVKDGGDAERTLELIQTFKAALKDEPDYIELRKADYDWMLTQFKDHAHKIWAAPDSAYLRRWLVDHVTEDTPTESPNGVAEIPQEEAVPA